MREPPNVGEERLRACLQDQYGLSPVLLEFLPRGLDYQAGVYRVVCEQGGAYLLKVTSRLLYEPTCLVPAYLCEQGITSVVAPVPTTGGALWVTLEEWTVILYPWIEGESNWTGMTSAHWKEVGSIFRRIHRVELPTSGFESLRGERFDPTEYALGIQTFETQQLPENNQVSPAQRALRAVWQAHRSTIHMALTQLQTLARLLQTRSFPYVICHADLHANNLIRDPAGSVFVIDWDEVMLAPKERDFIFIRKPYAEAFFQGYEDGAVDWSVLTYYLWERVVQDVIYDAHNVWTRDDWTEEMRMHVVQVFHGYLQPEAGNLHAALEASAHLAGLSSPP